MAYKNEKTVTVFSSIGFCDFLFFIFLVLKLTKVINWSWWWVTAPLWGQVAVLILIFIGFIIALIISSIKEKIREKRGLMGK